MGFDWRNHELSHSLEVKLRTLLCTLRDHLSSLEDLYSELSSLAKMDCSTVLDRLGRMCQGHFLPQLEEWQYVSGLVTLHKTNLLQHIQHVSVNPEVVVYYACNGPAEAIKSLSESVWTSSFSFKLRAAS